MKQVKRQQSFTVMGKLNLDIYINIDAESLGDALAKSEHLKEEDFVTILGDFADGSMRVIGVMEA